ncbi:hypothetical protein EUBVEN_00189 [Eubacterium ventriosum ATCC 27560]|uniref:Uncharacterized protein n=1 Tax=Eubacterium ventriosum ATCC 27560 TaxID=411463 RepID=A5Z3E3_9FIRM|nr:hypothetical protein EUBVEN_00189 [Eubacterium ventriosum ATCC 27560]
MMHHRFRNGLPSLRLSPISSKRHTLWYLKTSCNLVFSCRNIHYPTTKLISFV